MASRRNRAHAHEERYVRAREATHRGPRHDALEEELARQPAEIERLVSDNHRLATALVSMNQDLKAALQEGDRIREDIKNINAEGDVEIKILLDKIAKLEADVRGGDGKKKEHQELLSEARSLMSERVESTERIQQATRELEDTCERLPEMQAELETLRQEHQKLRKTFKLKKGLNTEKVKQMKNLEKDLIHLADQVERQRADLSKAEQQHANGASPPPPPCNGPYMNHDCAYPPPAVHHVDSYGRPISQMVGPEGFNQYSNGGFAVGPPLNGAIFHPGWGGGM